MGELCWLLNFGLSIPNPLFCILFFDSLTSTRQTRVLCQLVFPQGLCQQGSLSGNHMIGEGRGLVTSCCVTVITLVILHLGSDSLFQKWQLTSGCHFITCQNQPYCAPCEMQCHLAETPFLEVCVPLHGIHLLRCQLITRQHLFLRGTVLVPHHPAIPAPSFRDYSFILQ